MDNKPRAIGVLVIVHGGLMAALSFDCTLVPDITERLGERVKQFIESDLPELGKPVLRASEADPKRPDRFVLLGRPTADPSVIARLVSTIRDEFDVQVHVETVDGDALEAQLDERLKADPVGETKRLLQQLLGDDPQSN